MRANLLILLLRAALYVSLVASAALFADYQQQGGPGFCGVVSGCAEVRASPYAAPLGIPLPTLGLGAFLGLFALAAWASRRAHLKALAGLCGAAALAAVALIGLMVFQIDAICAWCMAVDVGAMAAALMALLLVRDEPPPEPILQRVLWTGTALAAAAITILWGQGPQYQPPPPDVARLQVPGKVTMVVFSDFQCPFCRRLHPLIREQRRQHPDAIRVRLVPVPLPSHPGADWQALAYLCTAPEHREEVADALYELEVEDLVYRAVEQAAARAGVESEAYVERLQDPERQRELGRVLGGLIVRQAAAAIERAGADPSGLEECITSEQTAAELRQGMETFERTGLTGLPSAFVGSFLVQGADGALLRSAVEAALAGSRGRDVRWMFAVLAGLFVAVSAVGLWRGRRPRLR